MTSRELQIFMTVAECGKMSEAARQLYITQSSVSHAVASIEKEYSILLFERLSSGLSLTADGEKLLALARDFFAAKENMDEFLSNAANTHRLRLGATVTVGACVISPILSDVREHFPGIDLDVSVANTHILEDLLLKSKIDIGLAEGRFTAPDLVCRSIIDDKLVLICSPDHPFSGRDSVTPEEVSTQALILRENGSGTRELFERQMHARHLPMRVSWSCYNSEAIRNAVADGHGVSPISARLVEQDIKQGRIWGCDIEGFDLHRHFSIVYHKDKVFSAEMDCFVRSCEDFARRETSI